jgi:aminoglycoside 6'-N-acetyltransferase I
MAAEVKLLTRADSKVLDHVAPGVFDRGISPRLRDEFLNDPRHHLAVAIEAGQVVGFASGVHYIHPDKPNELWINEVAVAPSHWRQGVGRKVVEALLAHAKALGCREAWVLTDRNNAAAMGLYAAAGGKIDGGETVMFSFGLKGKLGGG